MCCSCAEVKAAKTAVNLKRCYFNRPLTYQSSALISICKQAFKSKQNVFGIEVHDSYESTVAEL